MLKLKELMEKLQEYDPETEIGITSSNAIENILNEYDCFSEMNPKKPFEVWENKKDPNKKRIYFLLNYFDPDELEDEEYNDIIGGYDEYVKSKEQPYKDLQ